ncbi:hypothetical protein ACFLQ0_01740 [Nitrospinota bacterium]
MDWTWLLIIGGLMFVMHRFGLGCCGGHGHGGHGEEDKGRSSQLEREAKDEKTDTPQIIAKAGDPRE